MFQATKATSSTVLLASGCRFLTAQYLPARLVKRALAYDLTATRSEAQLPHFRVSPPVKRNMSSDADYAAFLDKANQDTGGGGVQAQSKAKSSGTNAINAAVPSTLEIVEEYFVSDADEPFKPVSLKWSGKELPSADEFGQLIGQDAKKISEKDFDGRGQYKKVVDAVRQEGGGDCAFFEVKLDRTRTEYFVIAVDTKEGRIVGLKAVAIET